MKKNKNIKKVAILINSSSDERHQQNINRVYRVIREREYRQENIYEFIIGKSHTNKRYPSKDNILDFLEEISSAEIGTFFMYVTGHGERESISNISLLGPSLTELDMERYLKKIRPVIGILVFAQCYGGGFAERLGHGAYAAVSASEKDKISYGQRFTNTLFESLRYNSLKHAFDYTLENDTVSATRFHTPQLFTELDANEIYL